MSRTKKLLIYTLFFAAAAAYFTYLQGSKTFADPDSFYHAKITEMMSQGQIIIKDFSWIKFAAFSQNFTDHHFLYHVFLAPFVMIFGALWGTKIASIILATAVLGFFYFFLKRWRIRWPLFYTLLLLVAPTFIFRINLAKAGPLSIIILLIALSLIWQKRYRALGLLSFLYVWTYGGWSLIIILACTDLVAQAIIAVSSRKNLSQIPNSQFPIPKQFLFSRFYFLIYKVNWKPLGAVLLGCAAGLIINPYFPANLQFYWQQLVQIGMINYQDIVSVGQEWYPYPTLDFLANGAFIFILGIAALSSFFWKLQRTVILRPQAEESRSFALLPPKAGGQDDIKNFQKIFTLVIFAGIMGVLTLKSQRFIEYFAPFATLAGAWLLNFSLPKSFNPLDFFSKNNPKRLFNFFIALYLLLSLLLIFGLKTIELRRLLTYRFNWNYLSRSSQWLKKNTPPQSLVYHTNWSDWPMLFYHNDRNTYLIGLDPTFFYLYNPTLYREWVQINQGEIKEGLAEKIKNNFGAEWALIKQSDQKLLEAVSRDNRFVPQFADEEAQIFKIQ